jgi:hypothetical protein
VKFPAWLCIAVQFGLYDYRVPGWLCVVTDALLSLTKRSQIRIPVASFDGKANPHAEYKFC